MEKEFKCINYGNCPNADIELIIKESELEETDGKFLCPICHQELELINKKHFNWKALVISLSSAVALTVAGVTLYKTGVFDTTTKDRTTVTSEPTTNPVQEQEVETAPVPTQNPDPVYKLPWGIYEGPLKNGVPHGIQGIVKVTSQHTIDLKNGKGESKRVHPGDQVVNCKFVNGKLAYGIIKYSSGEQEVINIGI